MKNKSIKIFTLALSALLLIGCFIGFSISAEEEIEPNVEIVFNNLEYGDNISILYATKVNGITPDAMKMNFYSKNEEGEYALAYTTEEYYVDDVTVNSNTDTYNIFKSPGIAPKFMPEIIYAQLIVSADGVEYSSNMSRFSVVEYCYKRLYKDTGITADQRDLYDHVIGYGTAAQKVLGYKTDDTPAHYFYVNAEGAVVDSVTIGEDTYNFSAGIFKSGAAVTLNRTDLAVGEIATWNVSYKDANGTTTDTLGNNSAITISDKHVIASASVELVKVDFEDFDASSAVYDKDVLTNADEKITTTVKDTTEADGAYAYADVDVVADPTNADNKALYIYSKYPGANPTSSTKFDIMAGTEGNLYVFSADINVATTGTSGTIATLSFGNSSSSRIYGVSLSTPKSNNVQTSSLFSSNSAGPYAYKGFGSYMPFNEWFNLRIEIYYNGNSYVDESSGQTLPYTAKYYVNDYFIGDDFSYNSSVQNIEFMSLTLPGQNQKIYLDNITFVRTSGTFTEGAPAESKPMPIPQAGALANGSGVYYSDANQTGDRFSFDSAYGHGGAAVSTRSYDANAYLAPDGYVFYEKTNMTDSNSHTAIRFDSSANTYESAYQVVEMDIAFDSDKTSFFVVEANGNGIKNSVFFSANADGTIRMDNYVTANTVLNGHTFNSELERFVFDADKWYNVRFEFYKDGVTASSKNVAFIRVFVDGVEYASLVGVDSGTSTANFVNVSLRAADDDAWVCFDNIFIGYEVIVTE